MKRIDLNFYSSRARLVKRTGIFLLLAGVLSSGYIVQVYSQFRGQNEKLKSELTSLHTHQQDGKVNPDDKKLELSIQHASAVIDRLAFPWDKLFKTLESSTVNKDVALLSIQPDIAGGVVTLKAEAKNLNAMLGYIKRLSGEEFFQDVHLVNHQIQLSDPQRPVRFMLYCALKINS